MRQHPDFTFANAYDTGAAFIFATKPKVVAGTIEGTGFNYGSTNILHDCPKDILILAEND